MLRTADGLGILKRQIGKKGLRLPYDYMVAAMPYLGLPIVFDSGLPGILSDFIFGKDTSGEVILAKLRAKTNIVGYRYFEDNSFDEISQYLSMGTTPQDVGVWNRRVATLEKTTSMGDVPAQKSKYKLKQLQDKSHLSWFIKNLTALQSKPAGSELFYVTFQIPDDIKSGAIFDNREVDVTPKSPFGGFFSNFFGGLAKSSKNAALLTESLQTREWLGCYFCSAITTPAEGLSVTTTEQVAGSKHLAPFLYTDGRKFEHMTQLTTRMMETNMSIIDIIYRPWLLAVAHEGLTDFRVKCNIVVYQFANYVSGEPPILRKTTTYYGAFPMEISQLELQRASQNSVQEYQIVWGFHRYEVENEHLPKERPFRLNNIL